MYLLILSNLSDNDLSSFAISCRILDEAHEVLPH